MVMALTANNKFDKFFLPVAIKKNENNFLVNLKNASMRFPRMSQCSFS